MGLSKKFQQKNRPFNRQPVYQTIKPEKILSLKRNYPIQPVVESNRLSDVMKKTQVDTGNKKNLNDLIKEQKSIMNDFDKMEQNISQIKNKPRYPENNNFFVIPSKAPQQKELNIVPSKAPQQKELNIVPSKAPQQKELEVVPYKTPEQKELEVVPYKTPEQKELNLVSYVKKPVVIKKKNTKKKEPEKICTNQTKTVVYQKNVTDGSKDKYYVMKQIYHKCQKKTPKKKKKTIKPNKPIF
jgi:hypothetical protein